VVDEYFSVHFRHPCFGAVALAKPGETVRLVSVIAGVLSVIILYLVTREAFGREVAFLAALGVTGLAWPSYLGLALR
jgi:asparagine N-glycosylation enzyme membrane subunit Stt3